MAKSIQAKIDRSLQSVLQTAPSDDRLRVIMELAASDDPNDAPDPSQFESRVAYRRALIERQSAAHASAQAPIREKLAELGLDLKGGRLGRTLVVEGPVSGVLASLKLPEVHRAMLDREIDIG